MALSLDLSPNTGPHVEEALREQWNRWVGDGWLAAAEQMMNEQMMTDEEGVGRWRESVGRRGFHFSPKLG